MERGEDERVRPDEHIIDQRPHDERANDGKGRTKYTQHDNRKVWKRPGATDLKNKPVVPIFPFLVSY